MTLFLIYLLNIAAIGGLTFCGYRVFCKHSGLAIYFVPGLVIKVISGWVLGVLFYYYYLEGDTITFFDTARDLSHLPFLEFWNHIFAPTVSSQPVRAIYFVRLIAVMIWLTHGDYWLISTHCSLISFFGTFYFVSQLAQWNNQLQRAAIVSFLFFPSVVFWSSGLLKESIAFGSLCYLIGLHFRMMNKNHLHWGNISLGILSFLFIISFKYYIAAVLFPLLAYVWVYRAVEIRFKKIHGFWWKSFFAFAILLAPSIVVVGWLSPNLTYRHLWRVVSQNHEVFLVLSPENAITPLVWFQNGWDGVINVFYYLFSGLFRPLIGEVSSWPAIFSSIENLLVLLLSIIAARYLVRANIKCSPTLLATVLFVISLALFLGYSVPNFGTLARYKVYFMPFYMLLILSILPWFRADDSGSIN